MIVTYDLSLIHIVKNSFLLVIGKSLVNLLILSINILTYIAIPIVVVLNINSIILVSILLTCDILIVAPIISFAINFYISHTINEKITAKDSCVL